MEQVHGRRQLSVQKRLKTTLGSKAKPTEMLTMAQHKATSAITSAAKQRSVQKWHISTKWPKVIVPIAIFIAIYRAEEGLNPHSKPLADELACWIKDALG